MRTPQERAERTVKRFEDEGLVGDGIRLERESFLSLADRCWFDAGLDRPTRVECLDALHDLMEKLGHFIPEN
jgi:ribosome assembly protein YihI (activator of Der GTPase)